MSAFERAWLFLKQGGLPNLFGDDDEDSTQRPTLPDIFDEGGNLPPTKDSTSVGTQPVQQLAGSAISHIGEGPQLAILGHRKWGLMHDDNYPQEALYEDMERFDDKMQEWIALHGMPSHIISGGFGGTDDLVQQWADDNDVPLTVHPPDFQRDGRWTALGERNSRIVDSATHMLLFPHPLGTATQDAWHKAIQRGMPTHVHSITSPPTKELEDGLPKPKAQQDHWYREFMGDAGAQVLPENRSRTSRRDEAQGDINPRLAAAIRRVHGQGPRMRTQSRREREAGTSGGSVLGLPQRAGFTRRSGRHLPKDTRTEEEKAHDRLIEMAQEAGSLIDIQPREGGGKSVEQQLAEIREARELSNEEAEQAHAMANLPIPRHPVTDEQRIHEEQMHEDVAAMEEGRAPRKITQIPAHRGTRGGRREEPEKDLFDLAQEDEDIHYPGRHETADKELKRRIAYNREEPTRARQSGRRIEELPLMDEDGRLIDLEDPHFIDDLRFIKMLRAMSPIDQAFSIIKRLV